MGWHMLGPCSVEIDLPGYLAYLNSDAAGDPGNIRAFEEAFSSHLGARASFATHQGRSALYIALKSLDLRAGDEVIIQSYTWNGLVDIILESGGRPVLVDCSAGDCNAHNAEIERKITVKTRAIIASHLFGIPCDIEEIAETAREHDCCLIEDCAYAIDAAYRGRGTGTFGDLAFFSFHIDKPLSLGQGGLLAVNNPSLLDPVATTLAGLDPVAIPDERCILYGLIVESVARRRELYTVPLDEDFGEKLCRNPKIFALMDSLVRREASEKEIVGSILPHVRGEIERKLAASRAGWFRSTVRTAVARGTSLLRKELAIAPPRRVNSTSLLMNSMRAGLGTAWLERTLEETDLRNRKAAFLYDLLGENASFRLPMVAEGKVPSFFKFTILNNSGRSLTAIGKDAARRGFEFSNRYWARPSHLGSRSADLEFDRRELRVSEEIAARIINLPLHAEVSFDDLARMGELLNDLDGHRARGPPRAASPGAAPVQTATDSGMGAGPASLR